LMIRPPRDLTELACLYATEDDSPECRRYLEDNTMETETVYRFAASGVEVTERDLKKHEAGKTLAALARQHQERKGGTFSDALRVVMSICPQETREYFRQG